MSDFESWRKDGVGYATYMINTFRPPSRTASFIAFHE